MPDDHRLQSRTRLFTVRIWSETAGDGIEHRGHARDVESGAFTGFRDWSALTSFLAEQLDEDSDNRESI